MCEHRLGQFLNRRCNLCPIVCGPLLLCIIQANRTLDGICNESSYILEVIFKFVDKAREEMVFVDNWGLL